MTKIEITETFLDNEHSQIDEDELLNMPIPTPLFLYVSPIRYLLLFFISFTMYNYYWQYRNWKYIRERQKIDINPFLRTFFCIIFIYDLFDEIKNNKELSKYIKMNFSVIFFTVVYLFTFSIQLIFPTWINYLMLITCLRNFIFIQKYINKATILRNKSQEKHSLLSFGHIICYIFGILCWTYLGHKYYTGG